MIGMRGLCLCNFRCNRAFPGECRPQLARNLTCLKSTSKNIKHQLLQQMKRALIFGFSVTADKSGFAYLTRKLAKSNPSDCIDIEVCGIGGISPLVLAELYDDLILRHGRFDYVFLEISTSIFSSRVNNWEREGLSVLYDLFDRIAASGARIALINLYRDDFEHDYHIYDMLLEAIAARHNISVLDLGAGLLRRSGKSFCKSLLNDFVHTNTKGSEFQAKQTWEFIRDVVKADQKNATLPAPKHRARSISLNPYCREHPLRYFERSGLELYHGSLHPGEIWTINLPKGAELYGISYLSGPLTGRLIMNLHDIDKKIVIDTYDQWCYYLRYNFRQIDPAQACTTLTITQDPSQPATKLLKGEANFGSRIGHPLALHYFEDATRFSCQ